LAFNPATGRLYATDNGSYGFDEVNAVLAGQNYGYPAVEGGPRRRQQYFGPIWHSGETRLGIVGAAFYSGDKFPEYQGDFFFCSFNTGALRRIRFEGPDLDRVRQSETISESCRLDVANAPDGSLYFSDLTTIYRLTREWTGDGRR
jgi:glucose/arabinose dehydrogenase